MYPENNIITPDNTEKTKPATIHVKNTTIPPTVPGAKLSSGETRGQGLSYTIWGNYSDIC
jgi:hypothetical protein